MGSLQTSIYLGAHVRHLGGHVSIFRWATADSLILDLPDLSAPALMDLLWPSCTMR